MVYKHSLHCPLRSQPVPLKPLRDFNIRRQLQRRRCAAIPNPNAIHPILDDPALDAVLPVRHRVLVQLQAHRRALSRGEVDDLRERLEHQRRMRELGRRRERNVELHDFRACDVAGVRDLDGRGDADVAVGELWLRDSKVGKVESRVRKTVAEKPVSNKNSQHNEAGLPEVPLRLDAAVVVMLVPHEEVLTVPQLQGHTSTYCARYMHTGSPCRARGGSVHDWAHPPTASGTTATAVRSG